MQMLSVAGLVPVLDAGEADLALRSSTLLDAFLGLYVRRLAVEWRRGHIRDYLRLNAGRPYLRGKLLFTEHIRRSITRPDRFYTQADELIEDVPLSRMLKLAQMGSIILPPVPAFYNHPKNIDDIVNHVAGRVLDQFEIHLDVVSRWHGMISSVQ